jgi:hypothetical protein
MVATMNISEELARCGCTVNQEQFSRLVADWRVFLYPQFTAGEFLTRPDEMREFRRKMQSLFMCEQLSEEMLAAVILTTEPSQEALGVSDTVLGTTVLSPQEPPSTLPG